MKPYAVIETGGKQYRVSADDTLTIERLNAAVGAQVTLQPVLAVSDGATLTVGAPHLASARVSAVVLSHQRGPKVVSFKMKRRKGYHRKKGHRQEQTTVKIQALG